MSRKNLLVAGSVLALASMGTPVLAAGTERGTSITNNVTVGYQVNGVTQNNASASNTFVVDRKINLTVNELGGAPTTVAPGQTAAVTTFNVTNTSNDILDFALEASNQSGGSGAFTGTDSYDVTTFRIFRESDGVAGYSAGDTPITYLDQVGADETVTVYVLADVPLGRATGDIATVSLTATAREGTTSGTQGAAITEFTGANSSGVDTVFADMDTGTGNTARDGKSLARDDYTVSAASVSVTKTSRVVSDPVNGTTNPKAIPGAIVEYCIAVANAPGSSTASNVTITDNLADFTTYEPSYGIRLNGTVTGTTCNEDGTPGGNHANGIVTGTLANVAAGTARTLLFRTTID